MTEGTRSVLFGCHNPILHGIFVLKAWRREHGYWPRWWQTIGIFLHDVGVWGREYLSDETAKRGHWRLGAELSEFMVTRIARTIGERSPEVRGGFAYRFCAGHCPKESGYRESLLARADKASYLVCPMWWLWSNYWVEWRNKGVGVTPPPEWRRLVAENLRNQKQMDLHALYLANRRAA